MTDSADELQRRLDEAEAEIARLRRREQHFVAAQRISHVGSYDFEIASNTNDWSDQLYRIYGREPGAFMATYERFLSMVHPDDRETILSVHQKALAEVSTYEMEERILWPDGQVRTLASWGEVVADAEGRPERMVGICWDITEQKATAEALQRSSQRFQQLIQSAPDVVLVLDDEGRVLQANERLTTVLGWSPMSLVGRPVTDVLPGGLVDGRTTALRHDGSDVPVDISTSRIAADEGEVIAAFLRDVTDRKQAEALALQVHDAEVRRRHALEINDNVVQGLASVVYLLDLGRNDAAHGAAQHTLQAARSMMSDLLLEAGEAGELKPGELVRGQGHVGMLVERSPAPGSPRTGALRVLLADDADDIRLLLRLNLKTEVGFDVVGEAADGAQAVALAEQLQPDAVVLDLSMPVMDGLQAIPELLRVCPGVRIVVLSGFDESRMKDTALQRGAHAYLEKGQAISALVAELSRLFPDHGLGHEAAPADPESDGGLAFDNDMVVHELRTPLTVITGMLSTLRDRMDVLPSATTSELVQAGLRNARQMSDLLDVVSDARHASHGQLPVMPEATDVGALVRSAVSDLCASHSWPPVEVDASDGVVAEVDPVRVRQVIANLLGNAVRYGTRAWVAVRLVGESVEISVADDGPGVPIGREAELFGKFSRLGRPGPGMGLGLYISRELARAHGGELAMRRDGRTTFVLTLPLRQEAAVGPR